MMRWGWSAFLVMGMSFVAAMVAVADAGDAEAGGPSWAPVALEGRWSTADHDSLVIDRDGHARFCSRTGRTFMEADVRPVFWAPATSVGLQLESAVGLEFVSGDTTHVLVGIFGAGEGDPRSLKLMVESSLLGWRIRKWYGLRDCGVLQLRSEGHP